MKFLQGIGFRNRALSLLGMDKVHFHGQILPPAYLRLCGQDFRNDDHFLEYAKHDVDRLVNLCGLNADSSILDMGCGPGRLAIGILNQLGDIKAYRGIDVLPIPIDWCRRYITKNHPSFQFFRINAKNQRYNPEGEEVKSGFHFPFADNEFDVIHLYSVFSHMKEEDVVVYLNEFHRVMKPSGKLFFTAFLEENVPPMTINPENYRMNWDNTPLHCVRYNRSYLETMLDLYGFSVTHFDYESDTDGQSLVIAGIKA
jgi:SAM-dependent methyltransferase